MVYLELGFRHIADLAGYDHILFVAALAISYAPREWRQLALLVTAFTIGHSLSLALATLQLVPVNTAIVESLIPATIVVASLQAIVAQHVSKARRASLSATRYLTVLVFGLVHGLGFSSYLRALLGAEENILAPLFWFNIGLELGQLAILAAVLAAGWLLVRVVLTQRDWVHLVGGATGGVAVVMLVERVLALSSTLKA